jgi:outer membrane protein
MTANIPLKPQPSSRVTTLARVACGLLAVTVGFTARADATASLSLTQALANLRITPEWKSADLNYQSAERVLESARAAAGLSISAGGNYNLSQVTSPASDASSRSSVSVTASTTVLPWSPTYDQMRSAERGLQQAERTRRDTRNSLTVSTTNTYFEARNAGFDVGVATANQTLQENQLRVANQRYQNGQITLTNLLEAQSNLAAAQSNLLSARNTLAIQLSTLGVAITTTLSSAPQVIKLPDGSTETLIRTALTKRNDVQNAVTKVLEAEAVVANAQRDRIVPNANVTLGYGQVSNGQLNSPSLSGSLNFQSGAASVTGSYPVTGGSTANTPGYTVALSASIPILAPSSDAKVATAQTNLELSKANLETVRRNAALDVAQRYADATTAQARVKVSQASLETARKTLETAQVRNQSGLNTAIDLETARVNLTGAERDLEKSRASEMIAMLRLQSALGLEVSVTGGGAN